MPKTKISEYSTTNSANTDIESINIDEGCAPSGINNAIRELMVHLKEFQTGSSGDPLTVAGGMFISGGGSANTLTVTGILTASGGTILSSTNTLSGSNIISGNINSSGTTNTFSGGNILSGTNTISGSAIISGNINSSGTNTFSGSNVMSFGAGTSASPSIYFSSDTNTGIFSPAADTIAFAEGGAEAMRIDSSGNLLVGITSARSNAGDVQVSKGISFPATQSAQSDANTLDDYEEGTWSPVIVTAGGTVTYGSRRFGAYRKIGSAVFVEINVNFTCSVGGAAIDTCSLPFTASYATASTFPAMAVGGFYNIDLAAGGASVEAYTTDGSATCNFHTSGDNIGQGGLFTNSDTAVTMEFRFSGIFFTS